MTPEKRKWEVMFAYSGSGRREFFSKEFEIDKGVNIDTVVKEYVQEQNRGEAKSDRIRFWSKKPVNTTHTLNQSNDT